MKKNTEKKDKKRNNKERLNLENLRGELKKCEELRDEYLAGWQRAKADFLNYKKSETERVGEILEFSREELILEILPILDNFNLAEEKLPKELKDDEYIKGILQIKKQFEEVLKNQGAEQIKTVNEKFNPSLHEIIMEVEKNGSEEGIIIEEIQKGYIINGKVIRPARVKVTK